MKIKNLKINSEDQVIQKITGEVLRAFHIDVANEFEPIDFDNFDIFNSLKDNTLKTRLTVKSHSGTKVFTAQDIINTAEKRSAEIHRLIKKNLYKILTDNLNLAGVPYGIMHGVRPTKIIHRWLREGYGVTSHGVIDKDRIFRRLRADYLTNFDKAQLLTEVAVRQIPILGSGDDKTVGVYVGIPFCVTRCLYCSFPSNILPDEDKIAEFMGALTIDINAAAEEIKRYGFKVQSIYIGGGTPTALPNKFFTDMMNKVCAAFYSPNVEEFTVECGRPDTITAEKVFVLKSCRVNRVSVNPQTMQQKTLDRIGRQHSVRQVYTAFNLLRKVGTFKINMDLILGLPGENLDDVKDSVEKVLELDPDNITLHALAIKRGSQLQTQLADELNTIEDFELPDDEEVRKMAEVAEKMLRAKKYLPYYLYRQGYISGQIENIGYCKQGAEGIYNVQIMDERQIIIGVGAAATTKVPDNENLRMQTSFNAKDLTTYLRDVSRYIDNRAKTLAEICNPETAEVEEVKPAEKPSRVERMHRWDRMKRREEKPVEEVQPVAESENVEVAQVEEVKPVEKMSRFERVKRRMENKAAEENAAEVSADEEIKPIEKMSRFERMKRRMENKAAEENAAEVAVVEEKPVEVSADEEVKPVERLSRFERMKRRMENKAVEENVAEVSVVEEKPVEESFEVETAEEDAAEVVSVEDIHVSTSHDDISSEEIFNEFLDEVIEKPADENLNAPKTDEEIFDNFLKEVFEDEPAENLTEKVHLEKNVEDFQPIEGIKPVENIAENIQAAAEKTIEDFQPIEDIKPVEDIAEDIQAVAEKTIEDFQPIEDIKPVENIEKDIQAAAEKTVEDFQPIEDIKPVENIAEDIQAVAEKTVEDFQPIEDIKPVEDIAENIQAAAEKTVADFQPIEDIKPVENIEKDIQDVAEKTVEDFQPIDDIKPVENDENEDETDDDPDNANNSGASRRPRFRHRRKRFR